MLVLLQLRRIERLIDLLGVVEGVEVGGVEFALLEAIICSICNAIIVARL